MTDVQRILGMFAAVDQIRSMLDERGIPIPDNGVQLSERRISLGGHAHRPPVRLLWWGSVYLDTPVGGGEAQLVVRVEVSVSEYVGDGDSTCFRSLLYCGPDMGWYEIPPAATVEQINALIGQPSTMDQSDAPRKLAELLDCITV